ncbi:hypothetical protein PG994_014763 [Apiospora phragmitis]|uniref:Uncharacterized protein n=1 Tax=Apiospora phragmitis TaxID=2905665 RepID=A0ABR1SUI0_9PEZI
MPARDGLLASHAPIFATGASVSKDRTALANAELLFWYANTNAAGDTHAAESPLHARAPGGSTSPAGDTRTTSAHASRSTDTDTTGSCAHTLASDPSASRGIACPSFSDHLFNSLIRRLRFSFSRLAVSSSWR